MNAFLSAMDLPDLRNKLVKAQGGEAYLRPLFFVAEQGQTVLYALNYAGKIGRMNMNETVFFDAPQLKSQEAIDVLIDPNDLTKRKAAHLLSFDGSKAHIQWDQADGVKYFADVDLLLVRKKGA